MNHPLNLKRQLRCIYLSDFFSGLRITDAVWVALLAARGLLTAGDRSCQKHLLYGQSAGRDSQRDSR